MAREDGHPTRTECYNIVKVAHVRRELPLPSEPIGMPATARPRTPLGAARKYHTHIGKGHVTFKRNPIDNRSVA